MKYYQVLLLAALLSLTSTYAIEGNWDSVDYNNTAISITALNTALNGRNNYNLQVIGCPSSNPFTILDSFMQVSSIKVSDCSEETPSQSTLMQNLQEKYFYFQIYYSQLILVNVYGNKTLSFTRQKIDMKNYNLMGTFQNEQGNRLTITNQSIFLCDNSVKVDYSGNSLDSIRLLNNTQQGNCNSSGKLIQALKNAQYYRLQNPNVLRVYDNDYKVILELNKLYNWNGTIPKFVAPAIISNSSLINDSFAKGDKSVSTTTTNNSTLKNDGSTDNKTNNQNNRNNSLTLNTSNSEGNNTKLSSKSSNYSENSTSSNKSNSSSNTIQPSNMSSTENPKYSSSNPTNFSINSTTTQPSSNLSIPSNSSNSSLPSTPVKPSNTSSPFNGSSITNMSNISNSSVTENTSKPSTIANATNSSSNISKSENNSGSINSSNNKSQNISSNTKQNPQKNSNSSNASNSSSLPSNGSSSSNISANIGIKSNQTSNSTINTSQIVITGPVNSNNYQPPKINQSSNILPAQDQTLKSNFSTQYMAKVNQLNPKTSNIKLNSGIAVGIWTPQFIMYNDQTTWPTKYAINLTTIAFIGCNTVALPINFNFSGNAVKVGNTMTSTRKACGSIDQPYIDLTKNSSYYSVNSNGTGIRVSFFDSNGKILFALFRNTTEKDKANLVFANTTQIEVKQDLNQDNSSNQDKKKLNSSNVDTSTPAKSSTSNILQQPPKITITTTPSIPAVPVVSNPTTQSSVNNSNAASTAQNSSSEQKLIQSSFLTGRYNALKIGTLALPQALSMRVNYVLTPQYVFIVGTCNQYVYPYSLTSQGAQTKINIAVDQVKVNENLGCDPSDDNLYIQPIIKSTFIDAISTLQSDLILYFKDSSKNPTISLQKYSIKNANK